MKTCIIQVNDEVNCKLLNLDQSTLKFLHRTFQYEDPRTKYMPSVRLGRWDGKTNFFTPTGLTYVNLLPEIIPHLEERDYQIEIDDKREYTQQLTFDKISEDSFAHIKWPKGHPMAGQPVILRDYQVNAVNDYLTNQQCIQVLATGAGKTLITAALSLMLEKYGRSIVIVPNKSLVLQTEADYVNLGLDVGVYFGDRKEPYHKHVICTWQSVSNIIKGAADITIQEFLQDVVGVVCDETHSAKGNLLKSMLCGCMAKIPIRLGMTGTMPKEKVDYTSIIISLGPVTNQLSAHELQERSVLAKCHVKVLQYQDRAVFDDYQAETRYLTEHVPRLEAISKQILEIAKTGNTLVLVDRVETGKLLQIMLSSENSLYTKADVAFIHGKIKQAERKDAYDLIAITNNQITIATFGVAAVGINAPRIFNVVLFEPGKSFVKVIQSIGRGIRKAEDKDFVQIWDITSSCKFAKRHLTKRKAFYTEAKYDFSIEKVVYK